MNRHQWLAVLVLSLAGARVSAQPPVSEVPSEIAAMLREHVGRWSAEGTFVANGRSQRLEGTRECELVQAGPGVICRYHDAVSPDGLAHEYVEILGYDAEARALRTTRVSEAGMVTTSTVAVAGNTMTGRFESTNDGRSTVGVNEITVTPSGGWAQRFTMQTDGQLVVEMTLRHRRLE